jgi:hypothetical protein
MNILHIHLDDTRECISIEPLFIGKEEDESSHKTISKDTRGKKLDYKMIFKDYK